jgi:hypothetical protein
VDMALCSCKLGFAIGRFPQLYLTHLIPSARLKRDYLLRLIEAKMLSSTILHYIWDGTLPALNGHQENTSRSEKIFQAYKSFRQRFKKPQPPSFDDEVRQARDRGIRRGYEILQSKSHENGVRIDRLNVISGTPVI